MATVAIWWTRGRGTVRVRRRRTPHVHCVACRMSLELPHATEGDRIVCPSCRESIVVGPRRKHLHKRPRLGLGLGRAAMPLRGVAQCALVALLVTLVFWYLVDPTPFRVVAALLEEGARSSWGHVLEIFRPG